jgi:RimJ/RimL family protein N-acetyltransferase
VTGREIVSARDGVALAAVAEGDLDALRAESDQVFDVDPDDRPSRVRAEAYRLVIVDELTGELLGQVNWRAVGYGRTAGGDAWNVGIRLRPAARGRGMGALALRLLVEHLFATTDVDRIEAGTEVDNLSARKALGRAGFRIEGIARGVIVRDGLRRDDVRYGLLRQDFAEVGAERVIVAERDGVALAEPLPGDRLAVFDRCTSEFDLDADTRPPPAWPTQSTWLTILAGGEPVGGLSMRAATYGGTVGNLAWNLGIGLLPEARGRGIGSAAQRLAAEYLFDTTELARVEATTDVDNVAEQRALEKAGFTREGVTRGAQVRGGIRRDVVHYGLLRSDLVGPVGEGDHA